MSDDNADDIPISADDKIVTEAKKRFRRCEEWESTARARFLDDLKFANGDAYNRYQWPTDLYQLRDDDSLPCLTINKTRQHNLQIINDARQNKSSIKISPTGGGATYESAQVFEGVVRHIEYISNAQTAYSTAQWFQVTGGKGYIRVVRDYLSDDSLDQELFIRPIDDPLTVYCDPDCKQFDRSDARFWFIFDDVPKDQFDEQYPKFKDNLPQDNTFQQVDTWFNRDTVRIAEYYRVLQKEDQLLELKNLQGQSALIKRSDREAIEQFEPALAGLDSRSFKSGLKALTQSSRTIHTNTVQWFKLVGNEIVERTEWPGSTIPIVPVIGEETVIDGIYDCKGHTRALIDPQRMYNYWNSEAAAQVSYQGKTPWLVPVGGIEELEEYYTLANRTVYAALPYNPFDDQGRPLPPPQKAEPPVMSQAYLQGMQTAANDMALVSGQYQADFGAPSNERSGVAIQQRQRQGENSTYHFIDHFAASIRAVGKILIEVIPKVYDTPRIIKILAEDDTTETGVLIDPKAPTAVNQAQQGKTVDPSMASQEAQQAFQQELQNVHAIFNPSVGKYDVQADIGPSFGTQRQEAFNAMVQLGGQSEKIMDIGGDLILRAADFPFADKLADRFEKTIPPNILGTGPDPAIVALQGQVQGAQQLIQALTQKLKDQSDKIDIDHLRLQVDAHKAETARIGSLKDVFAQDPAGTQMLLRQAVAEALGLPSLDALPAPNVSLHLANPPPPAPDEEGGGGAPAAPSGQ